MTSRGSKTHHKSTEDPRFVSLNSDPRFRKPKKKAQKVLVDDRFRDVLAGQSADANSGGSRKAPKIDRYGKKLSKSKQNNLDRFYALENGASREDDQLQKIIRGDILLESSDEERDQNTDSDSDSGTDPVFLAPAKERLRARQAASKHQKKKVLGKDAPLNLEEELDEAAIAEADQQAQVALEADNLEEEDINTIREGEETRRFAVVNLDWDHIRALDLYKLFSSFLPRANKESLKSVKIYPSDFGKEQMRREEREGPPVEIFKEIPSDARLDRAKRAMRGAEAALLESDDESSDTLQEGDVPSDDDSDANQAESDLPDMDEQTFIQQLVNEGEEFNEEALREYQLNRLRYYYAIVEFETTVMAKTVFKACNGHEFERSANVLDLRYVPDDMTFDEEPRDEMSANSGSSQHYEPREFVTSALRHSKVKLTWDDDDIDRTRTTRHQISGDDLDKINFDQYLASSESEAEDDIAFEGAGLSKDVLKARYRALLDEIKEDAETGKSDVFDNKSNRRDRGDTMEVTFQSALQDAAERAMTKGGKTDESTIEIYKRKEKERREKKKANKLASVESDAASIIPQEQADTVDLGFNDPFFEESQDFKDAEAMRQKETRQREKEPKVRLSKEERLAKKSAKSHLASLIGEKDGDGRKHFDMREILKAEKLAKRGKRSKEKASVIQDDFEMDVSDPRFQAVRDSHHFAIDPNNPHFKRTKNMQKLLDSRDIVANDSSKTSAKPENRPSAAPTDNVQELIRSIKKNIGDQRDSLPLTNGKRKR